MPSWFDLFEIPITLATPDDEPSFAAAVRLVHAQIDAQLAAGVASERIVVGGFSQASPPPASAARCLEAGRFLGTPVCAAEMPRTDGDREGRGRGGRAGRFRCERC